MSGQPSRAISDRPRLAAGTITTRRGSGLCCPESGRWSALTSADRQAMAPVRSSHREVNKRAACSLQPLSTLCVTPMSSVVRTAGSWLDREKDECRGSDVVTSASARRQRRILEEACPKTASCSGRPRCTPRPSSQTLRRSLAEDDVERRAELAHRPPPQAIRAPRVLPGNPRVPDRGRTRQHASLGRNRREPARSRDSLDRTRCFAWLPHWKVSGSRTYSSMDNSPAPSNRSSTLRVVEPLVTRPCCVPVDSMERS